MRLASKGYEKQKRLPDFREFKCFSLQLFGWWCYERKKLPQEKSTILFSKDDWSLPSTLIQKKCDMATSAPDATTSISRQISQFPQRRQQQKKSMYKKVNLNILLSSSNLDMKIDPSLFILLHTQNTLSDHCAPHHQHYKQQ